MKLPFLTFKAAGNLFAIDAQLVREILKSPLLSPLPEEPPYLPGAFNLRGQLLPVMDLQIRLGYLAAPKHLDRLCLVIEPEGFLVAILVDQVMELIWLEERQILAAPQIQKEGRSLPPFAHAAFFQEQAIYWLMDPQVLRPQQELYFELNQELIQSLQAEQQAHAPQNPMQMVNLQLEMIKRAGYLANDQGQVRQKSEQMPFALVKTGDAYLALGMKSVLEFTRLESIVPLPQAPAHVVGLTNLRSEICTLLDLGQTLGYQLKSKPKDAQAVIFEVGEGMAGLLVDEVEDVLYFSRNSLVEVSTGYETLPGWHGTYHGHKIAMYELTQFLQSAQVVVDEAF